MRLNFKRITALASSALMIGMTAGIAAAAAYPAHFVQGGAGNFAVVYGASAPSGLDSAQATSIANQLQGMVGGISVSGGESFQLDKSSDHFNFNNDLDGLYIKLDKDELDFLADGTYDDGDIDEDYSQEIGLSDKTLTLFADTDYNDKEPTLGFQWTNGQVILNYTITYDDEVNFTQMVDTNFPMLGKEYYVLASAAGQIDILDTAETTTVNQGETVIVNGKSVTLEYVDATTAKFTIDGETTGSLAENAEKKLKDDSYIVVTDISYQALETGVKATEFAIGSGKIELITGEEAELNTEDIDGLEVTITEGTTGFLKSLTLKWESDRDTFLTQANSLTLPELGVISLAFGGLDFPADSEIISVDNGETLTLNMGNYDLPLLWFDGDNTTALGEEDNLLKIANTSFSYAELGLNDGDTVWWNDDVLDANGTAGEDNLTATISSLNLSEGERFIVTLLNDDLSDVETGYYEVSLIDVDDASTWTVELEDLIGTNDLLFEDDIDDTDEIGDVTVTLAAFDQNAANLSAVFEFSSSASGTIAFNKAVSEKGLVIGFPTTVLIGANGAGQEYLNFTEADRDDDLEDGIPFVATIKVTANDKLHVSAHNVTDYEESDNNWVGYVASDLASKIMFNDGADENDFSIEYYGAEVTADVRVVAGGEITTDTPSLGGVLVTDAEVSSVSSNNLIVVGGSCINTVAASLLGVSSGTCTDAWTSATGVGPSQLLIQSFTSPYSSSRIAVLVAGYEAAETAAGASRLMNQADTVDTTVGNKYVYSIGSAGTSTLVSGP
jgi:hypothetical protein